MNKSLQQQNIIRGANGDFGLAMAMCPTAKPMDVKILCEMVELPKRPPLGERPKYGWFEHADNVVKDLDPRAIHWYCDYIGGTGKSLWARHSVERNGSALIKATGNDGDFAQNIQSLLLNGWRGGSLIIDLPRKKEKSNSFFSNLECIKDGDLTMTKYKGGFLYVPPCNVIVLANFWPDIRNLSIDRWKFHHILERDLVKDVSVDYVKKQQKAQDMKRKLDEEKSRQKEVKVRRLVEILDKLEELGTEEALSEVSFLTENEDNWLLSELIGHAETVYQRLRDVGRPISRSRGRTIGRVKKRSVEPCEVETC